MITRKEVFEIKHIPNESDKIEILAEIHLVDEGRYTITWKKDYGTPKFSLTELEVISAGLKDVVKSKTRKGRQIEIPGTADE